MTTIVVAYDIADDRRRERVATLLSGYGPRVQLSVFECLIRSETEATDLRRQLRGLIDSMEDQVRLYALPKASAQSTVILGARVVEEMQSYWIIR